MSIFITNMNKCERYVLDKLEDIFIAHLKVEPMVSDLQRKGVLGNKEADDILSSVGYVKQTKAILNLLKTKKGIFKDFESVLKVQNRYLYSRTQKEKKNYEKIKKEIDERPGLSGCSSRLERLENKVDHILGALHESRDFGSQLADSQAMMPPLLMTSADHSVERLANMVGEYSNDDVIPLESLKSLAIILAPYHDRMIGQLAPQWFVNQSYRIRMMTYDESMVIALSDWRDHNNDKATWENLKDIVRKNIIYAGPIVNRLDVRRVLDDETDKRLRLISLNLLLEESAVLAKYLGLSSVQLLHLQAENMKFGPLNLTYNTLLTWLSLLDNFDEMHSHLAEALALTERLDLADSIQTWANSRKIDQTPRDTPSKLDGNYDREDSNLDVEGGHHSDDNYEYDSHDDDFAEKEGDDDDDDVDEAKETVKTDEENDNTRVESKVEREDSLSERQQPTPAQTEPLEQ
ncbi:uncharacterized protein LOC144452360 [Glandiceps talaboti]